MAQLLTKKEKMARQKASMPGDIAKALARVSGGLYVVTALNNSARGAMLASWVAQASFEPMGLTIAVAKDRAIESLMQVGLFSCQVLGRTAAHAQSSIECVHCAAPGANVWGGVRSVLTKSLGAFTPCAGREDDVGRGAQPGRWW